MTAEEDRTRLIGDIARVLRDGPVPDEARAAALTFIGWLARRMPGEPVSTAGVTVMLRRAAKESACAEWGITVRASCSRSDGLIAGAAARANGPHGFAEAREARSSNGGASRGRSRPLK